jgi:hypothetical protein
VSDHQSSSRPAGSRAPWREFVARLGFRTGASLLPARLAPANTGGERGSDMQTTNETEGHPKALPDALRLLALDAEDLAVVSCNLQDAVVRVADIAFLPRQRRFALLASRFDWVAAEAGRMERCRAGLHFEHVTRVASAGFQQGDTNTVLNLLSIAFEETEAPAGTIVLTFSGGSAIRLDVECVDAQMRDVGPRWTAHHKPGHAIDDAPAAGQ